MWSNFQVLHSNGFTSKSQTWKENLVVEKHSRLFDWGVIDTVSNKVYYFGLGPVS